ncbi:hypothetical protein V6N13_051056 [Hibiscus sabdariffa]
MTKGMSRTEATGPALAEYLGWESDLGQVSTCHKAALDDGVSISRTGVDPTADDGDPALARLEWGVHFSQLQAIFGMVIAEGKKEKVDANLFLVSVSRIDTRRRLRSGADDVRTRGI